MNIKQAINISKGCVMSSYMDSETKQTVIEALNQAAISKTETTSCEWCGESSDEKWIAHVHWSDDCLISRIGIDKFNVWVGDCSEDVKLARCPNCGRKLKENER